MRINSRGDRRYSVEELRRFLHGAEGGPGQVTQSADLLGRLTVLCAEDREPRALAAAIARLVCRHTQFDGALVVERDAQARRVVGRPSLDQALAGRARRRANPVYGPASGDRRVVAVPVAEDGLVLQLERPHPGTMSRAAESALLRAIAVQAQAAAVTHRQRRANEDDARRAELLLKVSHQIAAQHDLSGVLGRLLDAAVKLFSADHGAVISRRPGGGFVIDAERNWGHGLRSAVEAAGSLPLVTHARTTGRMTSVINYVDDPRSPHVRNALIAEGINTVSVAPLVLEGEWLGTIALCHDQPYEWHQRDRALFEQLAAQGAAAIRNARQLTRTATFAIQLQAIQQLGVELNRIGDAREIGRVIAVELGRVIDYHNVRVYRVEGEDVLPVAWRGTIGEYADEDIEQLRLKVGEGITGWAAQHGEVVNLGDAARDPRSATIPGTEDNLDESMLLAPMLHEDGVIGVLVLSKLGLHKFSPDDQRLLEIFAAIAAQAMANADATEQLRRQSETLARQVNSQRELMRVTESILGTLDRQALLEEIADRLTGLIPVHNICVELYDERTGGLDPIFARGTHARHFLASRSDDSSGISGHVARTGQPVLVADQLADPRMIHFDEVGPMAGSLIALPLRYRDQTRGVLTIERLGAHAVFSDEEYELAQLFGGHVSIALHNADVHHAVEVQAQTDALTGLLNHGSLIRRLDEATVTGLPFGLLMIDLDDFKGYNDRFGHQAGDVLLRQLAQALKTACRDSDEVYRYGGDEFAILLPHTSAGGARAVANKIRRAINQVSRASRSQRAMTASVGTATHPLDGATAEQVLLAADRACYVAKRTGRDRIATAAQGQALAGEFLPPPPTPVDTPEGAYSAA
jgi:diguanylate cyclase (GGDEF)-like protein